MTVLKTASDFDSAALAPDRVVDEVRRQYAATARSGLSGRDAGVKAIAAAFGYTPEELASLPAESTMGLSCGNPVATAGLRPGETVVDLGCGGGFDVFLAARKVGLTGRAIGIDMTPEMLARARSHAESWQAANPEAAPTEFHEARIERLPLPDGSVDCLISNCVINLAPDKGAVFREMHRVLKPGGRIAVSDIALRRPLPLDLSRDLHAYVGCIAGAILVDDYVRLLRGAGFGAVEVIDARQDLNAMAHFGAEGCCSAPGEGSAAAAACCAPQADAESACCVLPTRAAPAALAEEVLSRYDANDYAVSVQVYAVKSV